eukprot:CAMPEP_0178718250 /NCGR_PEP_ID=MMETSP0699-20121125/22418_1 /TAXON_ID=265572 /ORGANISM="Extubocellulus spinifer, Strain CCMP396" /LENGTH=62 /DNA_ID=CAMNT_0020368261 /DNA_START=38 /DNA_END=222 /DNA_ORIENTATION=-
MLPIKSHQHGPPGTVEGDAVNFAPQQQGLRPEHRTTANVDVIHSALIVITEQDETTVQIKGR